MKDMNEWNFAVQKMIDWIEAHSKEAPTLEELAEQVGYSKFYCSSQFQKAVGFTIRRYIAGRRLSAATIRIRDTDEPLTDIALEFGYSSQSALTKAFKDAYGCTPAAYRKHPMPIPLFVRQVVSDSSYYLKKGDVTMSETILTTPQVWIEYIPEHKFIGLYDIHYTGYWDVERREDFPHIEGILESMVPMQHPVVWSHHAGWYYENGKKGYFYGTGVLPDYDGSIPKGFEIRTIPASYYLVFGHPKYDFWKDNGEVMGRVESLAWNFDPNSLGYAWNEEVCQDYQRHMWNDRGYQVLRPVVKL